MNIDHDTSLEISLLYFDDVWSSSSFSNLLTTFRHRYLYTDLQPTGPIDCLTSNLVLLSSKKLNGTFYDIKMAKKFALLKKSDFRISKKVSYQAWNVEQESGPWIFSAIKKLCNVGEQ